jgi:Glycosyl transferase family 2
VDFANLVTRLRRRPAQTPRRHEDLDPLGPTAHEPNPAHPDRLPGFSLFAVVKTWMDEDVITAVVRNVLTQGADRVFIVDNGSTDSTTERAEEAGATIAEVFRTDAFDGPLAQVVMNGVVARESLQSGSEHIWWLYLDSDEFPEGPDGSSVREYLATLDRQFRVVGSTFINHLPDRTPEYLPGFHPSEFQPLCYTFVPSSFRPVCGLTHWKHPLQRFDRHAPFVLSQRGAHAAYCAETLMEPSIGIITHHFQYRDAAVTREKLRLTCGPESSRTALYGPGGRDGFSRRSRSIEAVYAQNWAAVETEVGRTLADTDGPRPWSGAEVRRWYSSDDLDSARAAWSSSRDHVSTRPT